MTAEGNLKAIDVVVIVALWTLKFLDNWLQTLLVHTSEVIYGDFTASERYVVYLLFAKCALACVVAVVVDSYNHKYLVATGGMALYMLTPVLAISMCISKKLIFSQLTMAASAILFVTSPAAFGVIFNQKKSPVRVQIRRLVSIMEFTEGLLLVMISETIPEKAVPNERYSMIVCWVFVLPFFIFILTILERIRKYVRSERLPERGVIAILKGIRNEITGEAKKPGLSKTNVLIFGLLLLPAFSLSSLGSVVANLKPANDTQFQHPSLKQIIKVGQLTVIPLTEVVVSFVPLPELLAEMLVVGIAHVLNIVVLTLLVVRMTGTGITSRMTVKTMYEDVPRNHSLAPRRASSKFNGTTDWTSSPYRVLREHPPLPPILPPDERRFGYFIINPTIARLFLEDDPPHWLFQPDDYPPKLIPEIGLVYGERNMTVEEETIVITARTQPAAAPSFIKTVTFEEKRVYFLIVTEDNQKLDLLVTGDDVEIPETILKPILIVQNTFVGGVFWGEPLEGDHELQVTTDTGNAVFVDSLPDRSTSLSLVVVEGLLTLTVQYQGSNPIIRGKLNESISKTVDAKPSSFSFVCISLDTQKGEYVIGDMYLIFEKKSPSTTPAPPEPDKPDAVLQTTYAMLGISIGLTSVGYIHFFWMGCPIRLRATFFAWFISSNEIFGWMAAEVVGEDIGIEDGIGLLIIAVITAIWHFGFGWYYELKIMPGALEARHQPSAETSNQPEF